MALMELKKKKYCSHISVTLMMNIKTL